MLEEIKSFAICKALRLEYLAEISDFVAGLVHFQRRNVMMDDLQNSTAFQDDQLGWINL
ncbi:hypothetical protein [Peptoniphilus duerdenii]|uniref:hypothetical protein n=1 Tax=Peptoniphilus duerdenii TaxID=507750 RepID=UPI0028046673|nr:hypothetical protein [Peptoniphilus duerdenii]